MHTYFDKLIFSSCRIKEHPAAVSFNEDTNSRGILKRSVTHVIFTPCGRRFDDSGNWCSDDNCMNKQKTMTRLISEVKKNMLTEWAVKVVWPCPDRPDRRRRPC